MLGIPVDAFDVKQGWARLATEDYDGEKSSPKSLGIKDGAMIAFTFANEGKDPEFHVEFGDPDELYGAEEEQEEEDQI